jgi:hypothetical protein
VLDLIILDHTFANRSSSLFFGDVIVLQPGYVDEELISIVNSARLDLRKVDVVVVKIHVLKRGDFDLNLLVSGLFLRGTLPLA